MNTKKKIRVGIIGCGTIGSAIAKECLSSLGRSFYLAAICDKDSKKASALKRDLGNRVPILAAEELIKDVDLVVEAASASVSGQILEQCIKLRRDVLVMSVGGIINKSALLARADKNNTKVYLPSGAICGIDGVKSACTGKIQSVTLTTRKPVRGLAGAPYITTKRIDLNAIKKETVIFNGTARNAVDAFPQNINVSAVLSLAGIGPDRTRVRIVTSPSYTKNVHEVEVKGEFGSILTRTENVPSIMNPKTSALAIYSAIATLKNISRSVRIGT